MAAVHRLLVDWDNDGTFGNALADVFGDLKAGTLSARRGRTYGSQVIAQVSAGTMKFNLRDNANVYNPQNSASRLVGKLAGGQRVRWTIKDTAASLAETTVWQGYLDEPRVRKHRGEFPEVEMSALGIMQRLEAIQVGRRSLREHHDRCRGRPYRGSLPVSTRATTASPART